MANCKVCRFFQDAGPMGVCRRYPTFQNRHITEWCGEFVLNETLLVVLPVMSEESVVIEQQERKRRGRPAKNQEGDK